MNKIFREEFEDKWLDNEFVTDHNANIEDVDKIADWWLAKIDLLLAEKDKEIKELKFINEHLTDAT